MQFIPTMTWNHLIYDDHVFSFRIQIQFAI